MVLLLHTDPILSLKSAALLRFHWLCFVKPMILVLKCQKSLVLYCKSMVLQLYTDPILSTKSAASLTFSLVLVCKTNDPGAQMPGAGAARSSQEQPARAQPRAARSSQEQPEPARRDVMRTASLGDQQEHQKRKHQFVQNKVVGHFARIIVFLGGGPRGRETPRAIIF